MSDLAHWEQRGIHAAFQRIAELEGAYHELIYAVAKKYEGETRHATALRYIQEREAVTEGPCDAKQALKGGGE